MTLLWGDTGKVSISPLKTITTTLANPREDNIDVTPGNFTVNLPTTQTASVGATFTIQQSDLPIVNGADVKYTAFVLVSGKNNNGAAQNVSTQGFKNGVSVATASTLSTPNTNYWAHTYYRFYDVTVGDVLNIQVWAGAANVSYDYCALFIYPTRYQVARDGAILKDVTVTNFPTQPTLTPPSSGGTISSNVNTQAYSLMIHQANAINAPTTGTITYPTIPFSSLYGFLRANNGDGNPNVYTNPHATTRNYARIAVPCTITFREVFL